MGCSPFPSPPKKTHTQGGHLKKKHSQKYVNSLLVNIFTDRYVGNEGIYMCSPIRVNAHNSSLFMDVSFVFFVPAKKTASGPHQVHIKIMYLALLHVCRLAHNTCHRLRRKARMHLIKKSILTHQTVAILIHESEQSDGAIPIRHVHYIICGNGSYRVFRTLAMHKVDRTG